MPAVDHILEPYEADRSWMVDALCVQVDPCVFYSERGDDPRQVEDAKRVCAACPVRAECLEYALGMTVYDGDHGVWGGTTPNERRRLRAERRQEAA